MKMKNLISKTVNMSVASLSLATVSLSAFANGAPLISVPEPSILGLIGIGAAILIVAKIRRK